MIWSPKADTMFGLRVRDGLLLRVDKNGPTPIQFDDSVGEVPDFPQQCFLQVSEALTADKQEINVQTDVSTEWSFYFGKGSKVSPPLQSLVGKRPSIVPMLFSQAPLSHPPKQATLPLSPRIIGPFDCDNQRRNVNLSVRTSLHTTPLTNSPYKANRHIDSDRLDWTTYQSVRSNCSDGGAGSRHKGRGTQKGCMDSRRVVVHREVISLKNTLIMPPTHSITQCRITSHPFPVFRCHNRSSNYYKPLPTPTLVIAGACIRTALISPLHRSSSPQRLPTPPAPPPPSPAEPAAAQSARAAVAARAAGHPPPAPPPPLAQPVALLPPPPRNQSASALEIALQFPPLSLSRHLCCWRLLRLSQRSARRVWVPRRWRRRGGGVNSQRSQNCFGSRRGALVTAREAPLRITPAVAALLLPAQHAGEETRLASAVPQGQCRRCYLRRPERLFPARRGPARKPPRAVWRYLRRLPPSLRGAWHGAAAAAAAAAAGRDQGCKEDLAGRRAGQRQWPPQAAAEAAATRTRGAAATILCVAAAAAAAAALRVHGR